MAKRYFRPRFEHLEDRRLLSAAGISWGAGFLPGSLIHHGSVSGEVSTPSEEDTFSIELDENQTITAVASSDGGLQPLILIRDAGGTILASGAADGIYGNAVAQTASAQDSGSYTIQVAGLQGTIGQYHIEITLNAAVELEEQGMLPNGSLSAAQFIDGSLCALSNGAAYRGAVVGGLDAAAMDEDWFSFSLEANTSATLLVAADPGHLQTVPEADARPRLELFDSQGTRLAAGIDTDMPASSIATVLGHSIDNFVSAAGGTFYARLSGQDLAYSFVLTTECAFDFGNNNSSVPSGDDPVLPPWEGGPFQDISGREGVLGEISTVNNGWTFMVYMDADNNLEGVGIEDFLEMAEVGSTEDVNIVVLMDRIVGYDYSYDNWTSARRGLINLGDVPDSNWGTDIGEADMGSPDTVVDFVQWAVQEYPADKYALVYWDHGSGIEGVCTDNSSGNVLEISDFTAIIDATPDLDMVGFDACLMAMLEIGYQYRHGADVMVASEASEWLDGWEYQNFLDKLVADPSMNAESLAGHMIDAFQARYDYSGNSTLSSVDLTQITSASSGLVADLDLFSAWMIDSATADDWTAVETASNQARRWNIPAYIDLGDFILRVAQENISSELDAITGSLLAALDSVVLRAYGGTYAPCTGLSIYLSQLSGGISPAYNDGLDFLADTRWDDFVGLFVSSTRMATSQSSSTYGPECFPAAEPVGGFFAYPLSDGAQRIQFEHAVGHDTHSVMPVVQSQTSAADPWESGDWYCLEMVAGDWLTAWTTTPGGEENDFQNLLDPYLELYAPDGQLLAADDNTIYGRNALVSHAATTGGRYWIRVGSSPLGNSSTGQYYLRVIGPDRPTPPYISETDLPDGARREEQPTTVDVEFSDQILLTTLAYSDLTIDGTLHSVGCSVVDGSTIRFALPGGLADGSHDLAFVDGAISDIQGTPVAATSWTFYIGPAPPRVVESSIHEGDNLPAGTSIYRAVFDQPLNAGMLDVDDVRLIGATSGPIVPVGLAYDPAALTMSVEFPALAVDDYTLTLLSGDGQFEGDEENGWLDLDGEPGTGPDGLPTGDGNAGGNFSITFGVSSESQVMGRHVFYNNSVWTGDQAIALDKRALLPGETATFENYTNYSRGINGIMLDIGFVPADVVPGFDDFAFRQGNDDDPSAWAAAPDPLSITLCRGEGINGSDRITMIWADGAISKQWLQVAAYSERLGMVDDDVFYWGNAIGETGDSAAHALVNATDVLAARNNPCGPDPAAEISNPYDFDRDGLVDQTDVGIAQDNTTSLFSALRLINPPVSAAARMSGFTNPPVAAATKTFVYGLYGPAQQPMAIEAAWFFHSQRSWACDFGERDDDKSDGLGGNNADWASLVDLVLTHGLY